MTTIYLVTSGCYSDYSVHGVYSTEEKAEYARKLYASDNPIEEYILDETPSAPPGLFLWRVLMDFDGNVPSDMGVGLKSALFAKDGHRPFGDNLHMSFTMWAEDEKHAVKIANERRAMLIATNQWTTKLV